jgi:hypothetical protein
MKKQKEIVVFDNYDSDFELVKADYEANNYDEIPGDIEYTESMFWDDEQMYWKDFQNNLERILSGNNVWIVKGNVGTWQGPKESGAIIYSIEKLSKIWKDCDYIKVTDKEGHLYFECSHHDGTNIFELKRLTEKGYNYWCKMVDDLFVDIKEVHETIFNSNFLSGLPHYLKKL